MGGRIPKSAQRAIDKANQQRKLSEITRQAAAAGIPIPRMMSIDTTPRSIMNMHEVYFNGEKQMLCTYVNVTEGKIIRWKEGTGMQPNRKAGQETCLGKVEIRRRGM